MPVPGERWSSEAGIGLLIARLRGVRGETAGLLKQGFERSTHWAHTTTALFVFASDILKPIIPHCTLRVLIFALVLLVLVWLAIKFRQIPPELGSTIVVFSLITAILSLAMVGLQEFTGDPNGAAAKLVPGVEELQNKLGIINQSISDIKTSVREVKQETDAVLKGQQSLGDELGRLAAQIAREKGVEAAPLRSVLVKLGEAGVRDEDIPKRLDAAADELIKLRVEIEQFQHGPPALAAIAQAAQTLIDKGDLDGARKALVRGREAARAQRSDASRDEAKFLALDARVDDLQLAYRPAAAKYAEAASLVAPFDTVQQWRFLLDQADELHKQGDEFGDNAALAEAIDVNRRCLALAPRSERPLDWATTQMNLGDALATLGERESRTARIEEAVAAFREALQERTRARAPLDWAKTQMNLGNALLALGERESGTARLNEAVTAFREALQEYTRARAPLQWAKTQNNLGAALQTFGERESGTARLTEAVAAYREASQEFTARACHSYGP